jgi:hypothetical protein
MPHAPGVRRETAWISAERDAERMRGFTTYLLPIWFPDYLIKGRGAMSSIEPPAVPTSQPTVVQQTTVIQVGSRKSVGGAVALAFFFGPLGMLYATVPGAFVMFFVNVLVLIGTAGIGLLLTIPLGMIWAGSAASSHNKGLGIATQAVAQTAPQPPAAWHRDPDGGERMRYWDGQRWTNHYADGPNGTAQDSTTELPAALEETSSEAVACGSCGGQIEVGHRFCPGCGTARETASS